MDRLLTRRSLTALVAGGVATMASARTRGASAQDATPAMDAMDNPTLFVRQDPVLGPYFADSAGKTLYQFSNDTVDSESACNDDCATNWPPFTASEPLSLPLDVEGELSLLERTDGAHQVAYNGMPLYYWAQDVQAGDLSSQGIGDVWWIVAPGAQRGSAAPMASPTATDMGTPMAGGEVQVTLGDYFIHASSATFLVGQEYTFLATNEGTQIHELVFERAGARDEPLERDDEEVELEDIEPGQSAEIAFAFTEPGNYQLSCHITGHYPAGMALNIRAID